MKVATYGFALIFSLLVIVIAGALLTGLFFSINTSLSITSNDLKAARAKAFAEMGLNRFQTIAHQNYAFYIDHWEDYNLTDEQLENLQCGTTHLLSIGLDLDRLRDGPFEGRIGDNTRTIDVFVDNPFEEHEPLPDGVEGGYAITLANEGKTLSSEGYLGKSLSEATARTRVVVSFSEGSRGSPYENAIFVGGQQGKILGGIAVYGSVHLMGNPADGISLDIVGGGIYNNYYGKNDQASNISAVVEPLTGISANNAPDLCTQLKIKAGAINRSDTSPIGWSDGNNSGDIPFEIAALYLDVLLSGSDPYPHTRKEQENYVSEMDINMPEIPSNYPDDVSGAVNLLNCPDFADDINGGSLALENADVGDSCFSNSSFITLVSSNTVCDSVTNNFLASSFTPDLIPTLIETIKSNNISGGKVLCVNGNINTGNLNLRLYDTSYQGKGTFRAGIGVGSALDGAIEADINIFGSITPANGDFPAGSALGLVSNRDINIEGNGRHAFIAFAEDAINISEQATIVGSLVAGTLEVSGVPKVAYVPEVDQVAANLTGLPRLGDLQPNAELNVVAYERR